MFLMSVQDIASHTGETPSNSLLRLLMPNVLTSKAKISSRAKQQTIQKNRVHFALLSVALIHWAFLFASVILVALCLLFPDQPYHF